MRFGLCLLWVCLAAPLFGGCDAKRAEALQLVEKGLAVAAENGEFEAEKLFTEAANICPDCGEAHLNRGVLQLQHYRNLRIERVQKALEERKIKEAKMDGPFQQMFDE